VLDGRDVASFENEGVLRGDVEAWMAEQPVLLLDAEGRPLRLLTQRQRTLGVEVTDGPQTPERLRSALVDYLALIGEVAPQAGDLASFSREAARIINGRER
jgi:hypothetical protein